MIASVGSRATGRSTSRGPAARRQADLRRKSPRRRYAKLRDLRAELGARATSDPLTLVTCALRDRDRLESLLRRRLDVVVAMQALAHRTGSRHRDTRLRSPPTCSATMP